MTELEKKLQQGVNLQTDIKRLNEDLLMKQGQLGDLLQDIAVSEFGYAKESKEYSLPDLLLRAYNKSKLQ